jgi:hypothetical protein
MGELTGSRDRAVGQTSAHPAHPVGSMPDHHSLADQRSQRERMLAGDLYIASDPQLTQDHLRAMRLMEQFNRSSAGDAEERQHLLRELLGTLGEGATIRPPFCCDYGYQTHIGARSFVNFGLVSLDVAPVLVRLGNYLVWHVLSGNFLFG